MVDFTADFTLEPQPEMTADFNIEVTNLDHNALMNRDLANQHPMSAITGLEMAFNGKQNTLTSDNAGEGISIDVVEGVVKISSTLPADVWGSIQGTLSDQTDLQDALDQLSSSIDSNHQEISNIGQTIGTYGNIVTHYVSEFATAAQGNLADTALQTGDNISLLTNNAGYITNSALNGYATQAWVNNKGYITGITSSDVITALGYTPYDSSNPNGYTSNVGTVTSVNNVNPVNGNVTIAIPTVNNASLSIEVNGTQVASFTANSSTNTIASITVPTDTGDLTNNAGFITSSALSPYALLSSLAAVATSGDYDDLSNKPTIPAAQVNSDWNATSGVAQILNKPALAPVATSGSYSDLSNKPTIPTDTGDLTNGAGYITGITSGDVTTALGYTPYSDANPNGYTSNVGTVTSVNNVNPVNGNVSITIPTITDTYSATSSNGMSGQAVASAISGKQDTLVSGTSIKTINSTSLLGSGNISITGLPSQTSQSGKFLKTNGTTASWANVDALPSQTGNSGKYLTTNGTTASWATISLSGYQTTANLVTSLSSSSTDTQYPSAKCVYDMIGDIEAALTAINSGS